MNVLIHTSVNPCAAEKKQQYIQECKLLFTSIYCFFSMVFKKKNLSLEADGHFQLLVDSFCGTKMMIQYQCLPSSLVSADLSCVMTFLLSSCKVVNCSIVLKYNSEIHVYQQLKQYHYVTKYAPQNITNILNKSHKIHLTKCHKIHLTNC